MPLKGLKPDYKDYQIVELIFIPKELKTVPKIKIQYM
jgi:hypothetical protein